VVNGIAAHYVGQMHVYGYPGARRYFGPAQLLLVSLRAALALAAHTIRLRPTIIQIAKAQPINGLAGLLAARWLGCPIMVDCDDYEAAANRFGAAWQRTLVEWWEDRLPLHAMGVIVNTRFLEQRNRTLGVPPARIRYVPNGITAEQFLRPPTAHVQALKSALGLAGHPTLIYLGTMSTVAHGVGLLLESFALAYQKMPQARLLMVGDGDERMVLQHKALDLGLSDAVIWTGRVLPQAARAYLALADASTDPVSDTPAMAARSPLKLVESLAQGVPVLTGDVGDRRETLAGNAGLIIAPGDAEAFAEGIVTLLGDPVLRARLAAGAQIRAEDFRWERLAQPWLALIEERLR
jgi:glycosyltransferase involved in cell wall biosynthesis